MPKGMMLAAGRGTRLGPLTVTVPKPLLPVANTPVMAQGIRSLARLGVREIGVNVSYHARQIQETFGDGRAQEVTLHWLIEETLCGTAGGLKGMQAQLADDLVVVIAGDAMLDVDLAPLLAAHRAVGAFASLATIPVADPSQYGVVIADSANRVIRFQEKPAPGTEISHLANTGIYLFEPGIFDLIPAGAFCDFALHVFPEILRRRLPFYAFPLHGYWTDIGNPGDYLQANLDYLAGRIGVPGVGRRVGENLIAETARVDGGTYRRCIIGADASLPAGCALTDCVVWPGTQVLEPLTLTSAVLTPQAIYRVDGKTAHDITPALAR